MKEISDQSYKGGAVMSAMSMLRVSDNHPARTDREVLDYLREKYPQFSAGLILERAKTRLLLPKKEKGQRKPRKGKTIVEQDQSRLRPGKNSSRIYEVHDDGKLIAKIQVYINGNQECDELRKLLEIADAEIKDLKGKLADAEKRAEMGVQFAKLFRELQ